MIPYGKQEVTQSDIDAVVQTLQSDFLTQGGVVPKFEKAIADFCSAKYSVAFNSATSALHIACLALGVGKGDLVWTSPITFVASANSALYCGAEIDFVDIDPHTYNMSIDCLKSKLEYAKESGALPKVVIPVHLSGQSCDMRAIQLLAKKYGFKIIEDASHAIGGKYQEGYVGNNRYSDITVFSFHPVKIITTGEGGAALTNSKEIKSKMALLRSHGVTRDQLLMTEISHGAWYYQQIALGFNYRLTDIQAALGLSQLKRLDDYVAKRHEIALRYDDLLSGLPVVTPWRHPDVRSAHHLYIIRLRLDLIQKSHQEVFDGLREEGIGVNLHYIPVHLQPYYKKMGFKKGDFCESEKYYNEAISVPIYPMLSNQEQNSVVNALKLVLK